MSRKTVKVLKKLTGNRPIPNLRNVILNYTPQLECNSRVKNDTPVFNSHITACYEIRWILSSSFSLPQLFCNNGDAACKIHGFIYFVLISFIRQELLNLPTYTALTF